MNRDEQFFFNHAGYSYNPETETEADGRTRGAVELARAEAYAREHEWECVWEPDYDADDSFVDTWDDPAAVEEWRAQSHEAFVCLVKDSDGKVLASCGGIFDPDREYTRVMEAELALEALHEIENALARDAEVEVMQKNTYAL